MSRYIYFSNHDHRQRFSRLAVSKYQIWPPDWDYVCSGEYLGVPWGTTDGPFLLGGAVCASQENSCVYGATHSLSLLFSFGKFVLCYV